MIPGYTSTGSKRPEALFGEYFRPARMVRADGCRLWDENGREYVDMIMALGAVALGYAFPAVTEAVTRAARDGVVGSLAPALEAEVAERLVDVLPGAEGVRFHKTGAEAVSAAVRVARVYTGRDRIVTCGYHGWLDTVSDARGIPAPVRAVRTEVAFNDVQALRAAVRSAPPPAAVVCEPVVDAAPTPDWVGALHEVTRETGCVLIVDEIKTGLRLGWGGAAQRYGIAGDITVLGKALGNGFPIAAVCGPRDVMDAFTATWVSSTLATEFVSLAAARAVLDVWRDESVSDHLGAVGRRLYDGLTDIAAAMPGRASGVRGIPEFCYIAWINDDDGARFAAACAEQGLLFKRNAYNFVALAHDDDTVGEVLERLASVAHSAAGKP